MKVNVELTMSPYENAKLRALMVDDDYRMDLLTFITPWGDTAKVNIRDIREVEDDLSVEELAAQLVEAGKRVERMLAAEEADRLRAVEPGNRGSVSDDD